MIFTIVPPITLVIDESTIAERLMNDRGVARLVVIDETSGNVRSMLSDSDLVRAVQPQTRTRFA